MLKMTKTKRMLIAILLGAVVMFAWGGLSHLVAYSPPDRLQPLIPESAIQFGTHCTPNSG